MKKSILVLLCCLALPAIASHIVGGEFELLYVSGNTYRVNMILYFDVIHGDPNALDNSIIPRIFRKRDNAFMMDVPMSLSAKTPVSYTQPNCSHGELITNRLVYTTTITLSNDQFSDPEGYYIAWERCCRNYSITNVISEDVQNGGTIFAGQTFYLEFPPVVKNGKRFINSSPHLFPPLNDYACPSRPYYVNFAGVDDDGDSLVYSLVTPLSTHTSTLSSLGPEPSAPYPLVTWRNPYSLQSIIGGQPDLKISLDGLLTATAKQQGLFVFAVQCNEFRDGVRIGQTRRDFQMLVVDACPQADPPQILGKKLSDSTFSYLNTMSVTFSNTVDDNDRCIEIQVSDPDSDSTRDGQENITIKAVALNFRKDVSSVLPAVTKATLIDGSTQTFEICFDKCPFIANVPYQIGIIAYDDACSLPLTDTLKINVLVQPPPNNPPHFTTPNISASLNEGVPKMTWPVQAVDVDGDLMTMFIIAKPPFSLDSVGMSFSTLSQQNDTLNAVFTWDPKCMVYDFNRKKDFDVTLIVGSKDKCGLDHYDTMLVNLKIKLLESIPQFVINSLDVNNPLVNNSLSITLGQQISLGLRGVESNAALQDDLIQIKMLTAKGNVEPSGYTFNPVSNKGSAETTFVWSPDCTIFQNKLYENNYTFTFCMIDNHCIVPSSDTIAIDMTIKDVDGTDDNFSPRNFITPNNDGFNDYFAMEGIVADAKDGVIDIDGIVFLPKDNCAGHFEDIRICNRWGKEIFKSTARDFRWFADNAVVGVYYYFLRFTNKEYKGTVTVRL